VSLLRPVLVHPAPMKRLILSALVLGVGCGGSDDPSEGPDAGTLDAPAGEGSVRVTWNLLSADQNGNPVTAGCPVGAETAAVFSLREGASPGDAFIDKFNCTDLAGTASDLPTGRYLVWVRLTSLDETTLFAESGSLLADVASGATTPVEHDIYVDHAFYNVDWTLAPSGGPQVPCSSVVGEDGVSILATHTGGAFIDTLVDCEAGQGGALATTDPLPSSIAGDSQYTIAISLINTQGQSIGDAATIPASPDRALDYGNKFVDLGTVEIVLE
jgi:hypothetical protein